MDKIDTRGGFLVEVLEEEIPYWNSLSQDVALTENCFIQDLKEVVEHEKMLRKSVEFQQMCQEPVRCRGYRSALRADVARTCENLSMQMAFSAALDPDQ